MLFRSQVVTQAQRCVGRDVSQGSIPQRVRTGITILSILITWSLENAIETADSMKSRGYGTKRRTAFSIYTWNKRDSCALIYLLALGVCVIISSMCGNLFWRYFPDIRGMTNQLFSVLTYIAFAGICITPIFIDGKEALYWRSLK